MRAIVRPPSPIATMLYIPYENQPKTPRVFVRVLPHYVNTRSIRVNHNIKPNRTESSSHYGLHLYHVVSAAVIGTVHVSLVLFCFREMASCVTVPPLQSLYPRISVQSSVCVQHVIFRKAAKKMQHNFWVSPYFLRLFR